MCLGRIFNHLKTILRGYFIDWVHVGGLAVQMNGDNRARVLCDCRFNAAGIDIVSPLIRFDGNWSSPSMRDRQPCSDIGVGRHQHLIAGSYV